MTRAPGKRIEKRSKPRLVGWAARWFPSRPVDPASFDRDAARHVLVIRPHNERGDMLLMVPLLRALRSGMPRASITLLASEVNADVVRGSPFVDRLLAFAPRRLRRRPWETASLLAALRDPRPDLVLVPCTVSWSVTSALLARWSGAPFRAGTDSSSFGHAASRFALNVVVAHPGEDRHESERNLAVLTPFGISTDDLSPLYVPSPEAEASAERFTRERAAASTGNASGEGFALLHVGAGKLPNRWPAERFGLLAARLAREGWGDPVFVAGPAEEELLAPARNACAEATGRDASVLRGRTLGELAALARRATIYVGNDTGPLHLAAAVGAFTIALLGPTDPRRWLPRTPRTHAICAPDGHLDRLTVDEVWDTLAPLLERESRQRVVPEPETR